MSDIPNLKYSSAFLDNSLNTLRTSYVQLHRDIFIKEKKFITVLSRRFNFCYINIPKPKLFFANYTC